MIVGLAVLAVLDEQKEQHFIKEVYLKYNRLLFKRIYNRVSNYDLAEEMLQDVFVRLIPKIEKLHTLQEAALVSYIVLTADNLCKDYYKKSGKDVVYLSSMQDSGETIVDTDLTIEEKVILSERAGMLNKIWPKIPESDRNLLQEKYVLQMRDDEVAARHGVKPSSVRMMLTRARNKAFTAAKEEGLLDGRE